MKLVRLEIKNYRSIKQLVGEDAISFDGRDCLVGKNNAGKSNILEAISFLLGEESLSDDHYHNGDTSLTIDVRGYFLVEASDFERLEDEEHELIHDYMLEDGTIGICRQSNDTKLKFIGLYPSEERLQSPRFKEFHEQAWQDKDGKANFRDTMLEEYPELEDYLTEGKETNKTEWPAAYERFVLDRPEQIEFLESPANPPNDLSQAIGKLLPEPIFVPAVKEVSDATKTTSRAEFGALLSQLSHEIETELDEAIDAAMANVYKQLNIVPDPDTGDLLDERHNGVRTIEDRISAYLSETFQGVSVLLEFPNPESHVMFSNARVLIKESGFDEKPVDCVGEGVKRILIFSLIRTLADLRQGKFSVGEVEEDEQIADEQKSKPLLILYEEAELFLHPGLQRILLRTFEDLADAGDQVIFTTHSPFMLSEDLSTINRVSKDSEDGTQVASFHAVLEERDDPEKVRLLQVQNVSSYIFADRVLLVEGPSDRIVIKKIATVLQRDFEREGVPVLPVTGKSDLCLYKDFLEDLGIETFILTDLDAVEDIILDLCKGDSQAEIKSVRDNLLQRAQALGETEEFQPKINKKFADKLANRYRWSQVFDDLEDLYEILTDEEEEPTDQQLGSLEKLLLKRKEDAKRKALRSDEKGIVEPRSELVELLLGEKVLLLNGTIEDYYPGGSKNNKVGSALDFDPEALTEEDLCSHFSPIGDDTTDMELFLSLVFE
jgi:hypothetical protein